MEILELTPKENRPNSITDKFGGESGIYNNGTDYLTNRLVFSAIRRQSEL